MFSGEFNVLCYQPYTKLKSKSTDVIRKLIMKNVCTVRNIKFMHIKIKNLCFKLFWRLLIFNEKHEVMGRANLPNFPT
jgi:hypothetical protein